MYFYFIVKRCKVQNWSPFLLVNKSGGNRNNFRLSCVFIKESHAVSENPKIFCKISCKIFSSEVFTQPAQASRVPKWQDSAWSKEGHVRPGVKVRELAAQAFPAQMPFTLSLFFSSSPCLHPTPKEKSRQCFSWLPAFPTHARHPRLPNLSAAFLLPLGRCGLGG